MSAQADGYSDDTYNKTVDHGTIECGDGRPIVEDRHGQKAVRLLVHLPTKEGSNACNTHDQRCKCSGGSPGVLNAAKREADKEAGKAADEDDRANPIGLLQLLRDGQLSSCIHPNEEGSDHETNAAERVVDVKAPAPRHIFHESSTYYGTDNAADRPRAEDHGKVLGSLSEGNDVAEDHLCDSDDATSTNTLNGTSGKQHSEVVRN